MYILSEPRVTLKDRADTDSLRFKLIYNHFDWITIIPISVHSSSSQLVFFLSPCSLRLLWACSYAPIWSILSLLNDLFAANRILITSSTHECKWYFSRLILLYLVPFHPLFYNKMAKFAWYNSYRKFHATFIQKLGEREKKVEFKGITCIIMEILNWNILAEARFYDLENHNAMWWWNTPTEEKILTL